MERRKILTAQILEINLKKGWDIVDFAQYYEIEESEFWLLLKKAIKNPNAFNTYKKRLEKNKKNKREKVVDSISLIEEIEEIKDIEDIESTTSFEQFEDESLEMSNQEELELFIKEKSEIEENIKQIQEKKASLILEQGKKNEVREGLLAKIGELQEKLSETEKEVATIIKEIDVSEEKVKLGQQRLVVVQEKIKELSKVTIFAYENGEIDSETMDVPESWNTTFNRLMTHESVENIKVIQVKQISKIITLKQALIQEGKNVEIIFDDSNTQRAFEQLSI